VSIKMKKHVAAPIFGDDAAYLNPCAANGSGRRTRSSRVPRRRGVRGKPVALDRVRVRGLHQEQRHIT
jgi:hypothetical protein